MKLDLFTYDLPPELIAQEPLEQRDASRMLVFDKNTGKIEHKKFQDLPQYVRPNDGLVFNKSKVVKARLLGVRDTGGKVEVFLLRKIEAFSSFEATYEALVKATAGNKIGIRFSIGNKNQLSGEVLAQKSGEMIFLVKMKTDGTLSLAEAIVMLGAIPLPPYINRAASRIDEDRYQTVYAEEEGSVAAPTAGLHFTPEVKEKLNKQGTQLFYVNLHVGLGTFQPIKVDDVNAHEMHEEFFSLPENLLQQCVDIRKQKGRVIAVGTTSVRTLESAARGMKNSTRLFLKPGEEFLAVDGIFTNFHQPKSSLIVMMSAFLGREKLLEIYEEAVKEKYRFFSYGDCMLVL